MLWQGIIKDNGYKANRDAYAAGPVQWDTAGMLSSYSLYSPVPPHLHVSIHPEKDWLYFPAAKAGRYQSEPTGLKSNLPDGCHNPCSILPVN